MIMSKSKTPKKWEGKPDARKGAGKYPNYWVRKTRSGHTITMDDTKGKESFTIQDRNGSMLQMGPDGSVQYVSHNGRYDVTYGENRIKISGAQDTSVDGDVSLKTKGDHNTTVNGNSVSAVKGKQVVTAKSMNMAIAEQHDVVAGSKTEKVQNSSTTHVLGASSTLSKGGMIIGSTGDSMEMGGKSQVGIKSGQQTVIESGAKMSMKSAADTAIQSEGKMSMKNGGGAQIALSGNRIYLNSGQADDADNVEGSVAFKSVPAPASEPDVIAV